MQIIIVRAYLFLTGLLYLHVEKAINAVTELSSMRIATPLSIKSCRVSYQTHDTFYKGSLGVVIDGFSCRDAAHVTPFLVL